jgi:hypothetical protein
MSDQPDFKAQVGMLTEVIQNRHHRVHFFPPFHCELNWIEYYWWAAKRHARDHCEYTIDALRQTLPISLSSVPDSTIHAFYHKCLRCIQAYRDRVDFGTPEYEQYLKAYKSHRRVYFLTNDM